MPAGTFNLRSPHFTSRAIFIADGEATISQGEAVMGYVQDEKLGTIVGASTGVASNGDITIVRGALSACI